MGKEIWNEVLINSTFKVWEAWQSLLGSVAGMAMMEGFREKDCNVKVNEVSAAYVIKKRQRRE